MKQPRLNQSLFFWVFLQRANKSSAPPTFTSGPMFSTEQEENNGSMLLSENLGEIQALFFFFFFYCYGQEEVQKKEEEVEEEGVLHRITAHAA